MLKQPFKSIGKDEAQEFEELPLEPQPNHVEFRFGDVYRGRGPDDIVELDFPGPAEERGEPVVNGQVENFPHVIDLYARILRRYPNGATWRNLRDDLKGWGSKKYQERRQQLVEGGGINELLSETKYISVPDDNSPDGKRYVRVMAWDDIIGRDGGGQIIETSLVLHCWLLDYTEETAEDPDRQPDLGDELLSIMEERLAKSANVDGGLTGSVGAAALLVYPDYFADHGYPSARPVGGFSHLESLQVNSVVRDHISTRVSLMMRLVPEMSIVLGQPKQDEERISLFYAVAQVASYIRSRQANVLTVSGREHTCPVMLAYYFGDRNIVDRAVGVWISRAAVVTYEEACAAIEEGLKNKTLKYGRPDANNRYKLDLMDRKALKLSALERLIPILLYVREHDVVLKGFTPKKDWFGRVKNEPYEVNIFGADLIDQILAKLGTDLVTLTSNGSRVVALSTFEQWLLDNYKDLTEAQVTEHLADQEHWSQLAWLFGNAFIGPNTTINTKLFTLGDGACILVGQPIMYEEDLAIRVCKSVSENVEDPFAPVRKQREERKQVELLLEAAAKKRAATKAAVQARKKGNKKH